MILVPSRLMLRSCVVLKTVSRCATTACTASELRAPPPQCQHIASLIDLRIQTRIAKQGGKCFGLVPLFERWGGYLLEVPPGR
jgi:hypothetical protein